MIMYLILMIYTREKRNSVLINLTDAEQTLDDITLESPLESQFGYTVSFLNFNGGLFAGSQVTIFLWLTRIFTLRQRKVAMIKSLFLGIVLRQT